MFANVLCMTDMLAIRLMSGMSTVRTAVLNTSGTILLAEGGEKEAAKTGANVDVEDLLGRTGAETGDGALSGVQDMVIDYGAGGLNIGMTIFVYLCAICFLIGAAAFLVAGSNASKQAENKSGMGYKIAGAVLGFASVGMVIFAQSVGTSLFK